MNKIDNMYLRRQILDWRDKHTKEVQHHLNREIILLFNTLEQEIEKMGWSDVFIKGESFNKKHLQPIYFQWLNQEVKLLLDTAQSDLNIIYHHIIEYQESAAELQNQNDHEYLIDAAKAVTATGGAIAAIPTFLTFSTATLSAGGIAGFLGATTTTIIWPIALASAAVFTSLLAFGGTKAASMKSKTMKRYKEKLQKFIRHQVLDNKNRDSICQKIQIEIEKTATTIIKECNL